MLDIRARAKELVDHLTKNGFNGFCVPEAGLTDSENNPRHYACVDNLYVDYYDAMCDSGDYFDGDQLQYDFEVMLRDWFATDTEKAQLIRGYQENMRDSDFDSSSGLIIVRYRMSCQELEVYRVINGKMAGGDE